MINTDLYKTIIGKYEILKHLRQVDLFSTEYVNFPRLETLVGEFTRVSQEISNYFEQKRTDAEIEFLKTEIKANSEVLVGELELSLTESQRRINLLTGKYINDLLETYNDASEQALQIVQYTQLIEPYDANGKYQQAFINAFKNAVPDDAKEKFMELRKTHSLKVDQALNIYSKLRTTGFDTHHLIGMIMDLEPRQELLNNVDELIKLK